jgi:hypothetical protein
MLTKNELAAFAAAAMWSISASAQSPPAQLSARELFYTAADLPAAAPKTPSTAARKAPPKVANRPSKPPVESAAKAVAPSPVTVAEGAKVISATYAPGRQTTPLGLRYTLLKRVEGQMVEVAPDTLFHAGDRIQISVQTNDAGYLYIIHQGSSGTWKPLFPSSEIEDGSNHVEKGRPYVMPPGSRFYFDEQAGDEKLFVVLSRRPEPDLEKMIYSLQGGEKAAPANDPRPEPAGKKLYAMNTSPIEDTMVGRLRTVYARDLVIEKVDDDSPGPKKERAVYVVNPIGGPDSHVVADIRLSHK